MWLQKHTGKVLFCYSGFPMRMRFKFEFELKENTVKFMRITYKSGKFHSMFLDHPNSILYSSL